MHGDYERILGGDYPHRHTDRDTSVKDEVRNAAKAYQDSWSRSEDPLAGIFRGFAETGVKAAGTLFDRLGARNAGGTGGSGGTRGSGGSGGSGGTDGTDGTGDNGDSRDDN